MKNIILIGFYFLIFVSKGQQIISGSVIYKLKSKQESNEKFDDIIKLGRTARDNQQFELLFSSNESIFLQINELQSDLNPDEIKLFKNFYSKNFYVFSENKIVLEQVELDNKKYLLKKNLNYTWNLTNETKVIGLYNCFKAITYKEIYRDNTIKKIPIVAWYCPEIPFGFGPKNYFGLPGLILELHDSNVVFYASKLNFDLSFKNKKLPSLVGEEKSLEELKLIQENIKKKYFLNE
ncbi:MAG: GLPGLI family protein [Flavobacterium sp.]